MDNIEKTLGSLTAANDDSAVGSCHVGEKYVSVENKGQVSRYGIDVVLGGQWGDEGKGKLVDILSQVS